VEISELTRNIDTTVSIFAKACYYDAIADSAEDKAKALEYHKKVKEEFEKLGDEILILVISAWIEEPKIEFETPFIEEKMPLKQKYGHLRGDKV
jgi:hypothetical protein